MDTALKEPLPKAPSHVSQEKIRWSFELALQRQAEELLLFALREDSAHKDITSLSCFPSPERIEAQIIAKEDLCVAGMPFFSFPFTTLDATAQVQSHVTDGSTYRKGTVLATLTGNAVGILSAERTALNFLQHLCGIATVTSQYIQAVQGFACDILDTRKTLPGWRALQKYAVQQGGGKNHRFSLEESILIKNNHLHVLAHSTTYPIRTAISLARQNYPEKKIEIEVEDLQQLEEALIEKADVILLDNMDIKTMTTAVKQAQGFAYLEASGGVNMTTVRAIAETGVNGISIGALTHSVKAVDLSLRAKPCATT